MAYGEDVWVEIGPSRLGGRLDVPDRALGLVLFAHGSGSSRHSPRNRFVADVLNAASLATILFDLLSAEEEHDRRNVFDISLLGSRLQQVTHWATEREDLEGLPVGYFGASTGAGAALVAASGDASDISAVVCRGGRPDLAGPFLPAVRAPTLLIVGSRDAVVEDLNRRAMAAMTCEKAIEVIAGATHLFEEPGTLEQVAELARGWFLRHAA